MDALQKLDLRAGFVFEVMNAILEQWSIYIYTDCHCLRVEYDIVFLAGGD